MRIKVTEELVDKMELLYNKGLNTREIATELGCGQATVCRHLIKRGYNLQQRREEETLRKYLEGEKLFLEGMSTEQIAKKLKLGRMYFVRWLKEKGYTIHNQSKKYTQDDDFFEVIDTEAKAYWLGFIYADGCILEQYRGDRLKSMGLEIGLAIVDEGHLEKLRRDLNMTNNVKEKIVRLNGKEIKVCRLFVYSTKMCRDLIDKGCHPRKSLTLTFPTREQVPDHLLNHFVRGYIDGDGSIMWDTNGRRGRINIIGTQEFLEGMVERMSWSLKTIRGCNNTNDITRQIEYGGREETTKMLNDLYSNATVYLERKYQKYKEIIAVLEGDL